MSQGPVSINSVADLGPKRDTNLASRLQGGKMALSLSCIFLPEDLRKLTAGRRVPAEKKKLYTFFTGSQI